LFKVVLIVDIEIPCLLCTYSGNNEVFHFFHH